MRMRLEADITTALADMLDEIDATLRRIDHLLGRRRLLIGHLTEVVEGLTGTPRPRPSLTVIEGGRS